MAEPRRTSEVRRMSAEVPRGLGATGVTVGTLPAIINLNIYQGDDFFLDLTIGSTPDIDLTNYTPKAEIRQNPGANLVLATFDATIVDSTTIGLHLPAAQSILLTSNCHWDVQITDPAGLVTTVGRGDVNVTLEVTK